MILVLRNYKILVIFNNSWMNPDQGGLEPQTLITTADYPKHSPVQCKHFILCLKYRGIISATIEIWRLGGRIWNPYTKTIPRLMRIFP